MSLFSKTKMENAAFVKSLHVLLADDSVLTTTMRLEELGDCSVITVITKLLGGTLVHTYLEPHQTISITPHELWSMLQQELKKERNVKHDPSNNS